MALDYGEKRVGVASTDEMGAFALPRMVVPNDEELLGRIIGFFRENGIEKIIMGESKNFSGEANPIQERIQKFKKELEAQDIEVILHPEIMTTMEARRLQGNTELTDASAAALILKNYIDTVYNKGA